MEQEMDKDERKRLERLQEDGPKGVNGFNLKGLTYPDLQLLLLADPTTQNLIRQIIEPMFAAQEDDAPVSADADQADDQPKSKRGKGKTSAALTSEPASKTVVPTAQPAIQYVDRIKEVVKEVTVHDPLRTELSPELKLLKLVKADKELNEAWLWVQEDEGRQLVRLLACLAEWDEVLGLWGRLADRCKDEQRAATKSEQGILQAALALHNLRWRDKAAKLTSADMGATFHHETMERGTPKGSTVTEVWLPGLVNAAGQVQKKPVVKTT